MKTILAVLLLIASSPLFASTYEQPLITDADALFSPVPTTNARPCRFWTMESNLRGYTCSSYEFSIDIPDGNRLNQVLRQMEQRIRTLEQRILELESR